MAESDPATEATSQNDRLRRLERFEEDARKSIAAHDLAISKLSMSHEQLQTAVASVTEGLAQVRTAQEAGFQRLEGKVDDVKTTMDKRDADMQGALAKLATDMHDAFIRAVGTVPPLLQMMAVIVAAVAGGAVTLLAGSHILHPERYAIAAGASLGVGIVLGAVLRRARR